MTTDGCRFRPSAIPVTVSTSPSLGNGLALHFEAWQNPPIFKDVGAVNVGKVTGINTTGTATGIAEGLQLNFDKGSNTTKETVTKLWRPLFIVFK